MLPDFLRQRKTVIAFTHLAIGVGTREIIPRVDLVSRILVQWNVHARDKDWIIGRGLDAGAGVAIGVSLVLLGATGLRVQVLELYERPTPWAPAHLGHEGKLPTFGIPKLAVEMRRGCVEPDGEIAAQDAVDIQRGAIVVIASVMGLNPPEVPMKHRGLHNGIIDSGRF